MSCVLTDRNVAFGIIKDMKQTATNQFICYRVEELGLNSLGLTNTGFIALSCAIARF